MQGIATVVAALEAATSIDALAALFASAILPLGMTASASGMVSGPRALSRDRFHFVNWPAAWLALYLERNFAALDPIPRWAIVSGQALAWTEVFAELPPRDPGLAVYHAAHPFGFYEGYVTPIRTRKGALGLVSVGGGKRAPFTPDERAFLQAASTAALHRAELVLDPPPALFGMLTPREQECIALLVQGCTDAEIARVIGIAPTTVRFHLDHARRKLGARNRVDLAVRASQAIA